MLQRNIETQFFNAPKALSFKKLSHLSVYQRLVFQLQLFGLLIFRFTPHQETLCMLDMGEKNQGYYRLNCVAPNGMFKYPVLVDLDLIRKQDL